MEKRTLLLALALLPCFSFFNVSAQNPSQGPGEPIHIESEGHLRPRSIEPECYYLNGSVFIIGTSSVTFISATVTRLSDNMQWSDSSTSSSLQITVPTTAGTYHLELTLSDGSSYYGEYTLL